MSTVTTCSRPRSESDLAWKACFVVSSIGEEDSPERKRANEVLENYIEPACVKAGYYPERADEQFVQSIREGIVTSLDYAPMCVAYLGTPPWNDNVMVEVGYRIAARLPVVLLRDAPSAPMHDLPYILWDRLAINIPRADQEPDSDRVERIQGQICTAIRNVESDYLHRILHSTLPVAVIHSWRPCNGGPLDPTRMIYVRTSGLASEIFGIKGEDGTRLAGRTMDQFLNSLKYRMTNSRYGEFCANQDVARSEYEVSFQRSGPPPTVDVPIVFKWHPIQKYIGRAYLPIITEDFTSEDYMWRNMRVLYHDVTSCTPIPDTPPTSPISVFLSHNSKDRHVVDQFRGRLKALSPWIHPWVDAIDLIGGDPFVARIGEVIDKVEVALVFLGPNGIGPFQKLEIQSLINELSRRESPEPELTVVLVFLDGFEAKDVPPEIGLLNSNIHVTYQEIDNDDCLTNYFYRKFPDRFFM